MSFLTRPVPDEAPTQAAREPRILPAGSSVPDKAKEVRSFWIPLEKKETPPLRRWNSQRLAHMTGMFMIDS